MKHVILYSDGSCSGNPGPGGWAALLLYGRHERALTGSEPLSTNNRMELTGAVEGLRALREPCQVSLHTDSAYVSRAVSEGWLDRWIANGWRTAQKKPVENRDLWEALLHELRRHEVRFVKVKGHADDALNNRTDRLAVAAMKAQEGRREAG